MYWTRNIEGNGVNLAKAAAIKVIDCGGTAELQAVFPDGGFSVLSSGLLADVRTVRDHLLEQLESWQDG